MKLRPPEIKKARIEIIPMIDTIFFLLVFFMMASLSMVPMPTRRVALPNSDTAKARPQEKVVVTLARDGSYYLDRHPIAERQIRPQLSARLKERPDLAVVINCDRDLPASRFLRVFDLVKQANAATVMVATAPKDIPVGNL